MSLRLQAADPINNTEEDLEEEAHAPKAGSRGKCRDQLIVGFDLSMVGKKRKRDDSHVSEAGHSLSRLEREEDYVEKVIRQSIRKISLMLSEDVADLALIDINNYMETLSRLVRALEALQNTE
jgi:hypothetical protein